MSTIESTNVEKNINIDCIGERASIDRIVDHIGKAETIIGKLFPNKIDVSINIINSKYTDASTNLDNIVPAITLNYNILFNYDDNELDLVILHEFMHVYQFMNSTIKNWKSKTALILFLEGYATYMSSMFLPGFDDWKYISYYQKNDSEYILFEKVKLEGMKYLKDNIRKSPQKAIDELFVFSNNTNKLFPNRIGYYLGFIIVKHLYEEKVNLGDIDEAKFIDYVLQFSM